MCKFEQLSEERTKIVERFSIAKYDEVFKDIDAAIDESIRISFKAFNFRTLKKEDEKYTELDKSDIIGSLVDKLNDFKGQLASYFNNEFVSEEEFDEKHHNLCEIFIEAIEPYYEELAYGKAQKIVNLTFKHLYCMKFNNDQVLSEEYFQHCHMILDSFTLEWFYREVADKWWNKNKSNQHNKISKGKIDAWSNLKHATGNEYYSYPELISKIRTFFKENKDYIKKQSYKNCTPFQAEFFIWPEIQLHLTAEALFSQSIGQEEMIEAINKIKEEHSRSTIDKLNKDKEGKKRTKRIDNEINKLSAVVTDMAEAKAIYQKLSLEEKLKILKVKIDILVKYSNSCVIMENYYAHS